MASNSLVTGRSGNYTVYRCIGKGAYGEVFLAKYKKEKKMYVMKNIKLGNSSQKERLAAEREASLLSQLQHPNIVSYKESFQDESGCLHIIMGYCERGDLYTRLKEQQGVFLPENQVIEWFVQIALALQYLHDRNILHRDLKTQNVFLTKSNIIKVGDLGIARVLDHSSELAQTVIGTPYYMSPEIFQNQAYNQKSDIWALGCCVYEMSTLKHAFTAKNIHALMLRVVKGEIPEMPSHFSAEVRDLVKWMLSKQADDRPCASELLRRPFVRQHIKLFLERASKKKQKAKSSASSSSLPSVDSSTAGEGRRHEQAQLPLGRERSSSRDRPALPQPPPQKGQQGGKVSEVSSSVVEHKATPDSQSVSSSSHSPSVQQEQNSSSSNSQTLIGPSPDSESCPRSLPSSSSNSKSSGYHSNDEDNVPSPISFDVPSSSSPSDVQVQSGGDGRRRSPDPPAEDDCSAGVDAKDSGVVCLDNNPPVIRLQSDSADGISPSPEVERSRSSSLSECDRQSDKSLNPSSGNNQENIPKSSSVTSLSSARERRRKNKQEKQQGAKRSFSGAKMVLKSRPSSDVRVNHKPPKSGGGAGGAGGGSVAAVVVQGDKGDTEGGPNRLGLILRPDNTEPAADETDGQHRAKVTDRSQLTSESSSKAAYQQKDPLERESLSECDLLVGSKPLLSGGSPQMEAKVSRGGLLSSLKACREHSSEPNLTTLATNTSTNNSMGNNPCNKTYTKVHSIELSDSDLVNSGGSSGSLERVPSDKGPSGEEVGEKRSEEFDSMLTIMNRTLHLPPSEERRESTPTPPREAFVSDSHPGGRLHSRIEALRRELAAALGDELFAKAYNVLDSGLDSEDDEKLLMSLGTVFYNEYSEKLRQLKFCEESAF